MTGVVPVIAALAAFPALAALEGCAAARRGPSVVVAEGWAPVTEQGPAAARAAALADAQRRAAEQAAGAVVRARTVVEKDAAVEQRVSSEVLGSLERYEILSESDGDGFVRVRLRAWVARERPRPSPQGLRAQVSASALAGPLARRGWTVVSAGQAPQVVLSARTEGAPILDPRVRPLASWSALVSLEARAPDGALLWSGAERAAALAALSSEARRRAESRALELAAADASRELPEILWRVPR